MEMEMEFLRKLPTPAELKEEYPVSAQVVATKAERDDEIRAIFEGKEDKLILVIGPCSADNEDAVIDYISRLRKVQDKVADKIFMIPRIYTNKPRTIGIGYNFVIIHSFRSNDSYRSPKSVPQFIIGSNDTAVLHRLHLDGRKDVF